MNSKSNSVNQREDIIEALRKHPEGLTLRDIAEIVGHHRHTITKYVYELIGANVIYQRDVGAAKLCYLRESYNGDMKREERKIFKNLGKGQAQLIALFMILLLVPATVIVAQNLTNSSSSPIGLEGMMTFPNVSRDGLLIPPSGTPLVTGNYTIPGPLPDQEEQNLTESNNETQDNAGENPEANMTKPDVNMTDTPDNETIVPPFDINETNGTLENDTGPIMPVPEFNETVNETINDTNATIPNATIPNATIPGENITMPDDNVTIPVDNVTNITEENFTEDNFTEDNLTNEPSEPEISVEMIMPDKITRGQTVVLRVVIENAGSEARNVSVEWVLPGHFEMISGSVRDYLGDLAEDSTLTSEITIVSSLDAVLGLNEIKVRVSYE